MTTHKAFKRLVRARMAKTGERYAAARRALLESATEPGATSRPVATTPSGWRMRGGLHPETATLANVLAHHGVVSGLTGEPLSEAAILGIGGGLGAGKTQGHGAEDSGEDAELRRSAQDDGARIGKQRAEVG